MEQLTVYLTSLVDWLVSTSVIGSILVLFVLCIKRVLKKQLTPRWQYLLWAPLILKLVLPWTPNSSFSICNIINHVEQSINSVQELHTKQIRYQKQDTSNHITNGISEVYTDKSNEPVLDTHNLILASFWALGMIIFGSIAMRKRHRFYQQLSSIRIDDPKVVRILEQCKSMLAIRREIPLIESNNVSSPAVLGYFKPKILLPKNILHELNEEQLRYIFLHELGHVKRNDVGVNRIMHVALLLHWFNPILWYAYYRMREDQEIACDSLVLHVVEPYNTQSYGLTMIDLLESSLKQKAFLGTTNLFEAKKQLMRRIQMMNQFKRNSYRLSIVGLGALAVVSGIFLTNEQANAGRGLAQGEGQKATIATKADQAPADSTEKQSSISKKHEKKSEAPECKKKQAIANIVKLAKQGRVINSDKFKIGTNFNNITQAFGVRDEQDGYDYKYNSRRVTFFVDTDGQFGPQNEVRGIDYTGEHLQGLHISDIKKHLGDNGSEVTGQLIYQAGEYFLSFDFNKKGDITRVLVTDTGEVK